MCLNKHVVNWRAVPCISFFSLFRTEFPPFCFLLSFSLFVWRTELFIDDSVFSFSFSLPQPLQCNAHLIFNRILKANFSHWQWTVSADSLFTTCAIVYVFAKCLHVFFTDGNLISVFSDRSSWRFWSPVLFHLIWTSTKHYGTEIIFDNVKKKMHTKSDLLLTRATSMPKDEDKIFCVNIFIERFSVSSSTLHLQNTPICVQCAYDVCMLVKCM